MNFLKSFASAGVANSISRITGYTRDLSTAYFLGVGSVSDIYLAIFRFILSIKRIISEENFNYSFTPIYLEEKKQSKQLAISFTFTLLCSLILLSIISIVFLFLFSNQIVNFLFSNNIENLYLLSQLDALFKIASLYIFFIVISSVLIGILNAERHFFYSLLGPVYLNLSIAISALIFSQSTSEIQLSYILVYSMLVGGLLQIIFLLLQAKRLLAAFSINKILNKLAVKNFFKLAMPFFSSAAIQQLCIIISVILLSAQSGAISYVYYAERIFFIPVSILGLALTSILIPYFSLDFLENESKATFASFKQITRFIFIIGCPISIWLYFNSHLITAILFGRGEFSASAVLYTSNVLKLLSIGIPFIFVTKIIAPLYSSRKEAKLYFMIILFSVFINLFLNITLFKLYGYLIIPTTYVVANIFLCFGLVYFAFKQKIKNYLGSIIKFFLRLIVYLGFFGGILMYTLNAFRFENFYMLILSIILSLIIGSILLRIFFAEDYISFTEAMIDK